MEPIAYRVSMSGNPRRNISFTYCPTCYALEKKADELEGVKSDPSEPLEPADITDDMMYKDTLYCDMCDEPIDFNI